ncbi:MAG: thioredoxin [Chloroflexi bacterium]|nr:MAG: thioredoxin [Chloroflexota bacterium]
MSVKTKNNVIEVSERTFQTDVIERSREVPVVVDFWAEWCGPCRMLGPILERLAAEANGDWVLAKVDVDQNPQLAAYYGVRGIPAVKAFVDGRVADEFVGAQPEPMVRQFIQGLVPSKADRRVKAAEAAEVAGGLEKAETVYREILEEDPYHARALLGLGRVLFGQGRLDEAAETLRRVPLHEPARKDAEKLLAQIEFRQEAEACGGLDACREKLAADPNNVAARYGVAMALAAEGHYEDALRHLLAIVKQDRTFRDDAARRAMLSIFNILGETSPLAQEYRSKLAMAIF